jgi:hypothetical protein
MLATRHRSTQAQRQARPTAHDSHSLVPVRLAGSGASSPSAECLAQTFAAAAAVDQMAVVVLASTNCRLSWEAAVDLVGHGLVEGVAGLCCLQNAPSLIVRWNQAWVVAIEVGVVCCSFAVARAVPGEVIPSCLERL